MVQRQRWLILMVAMVGIGIAGCSSKAASPRTQATAALAPTNPPAHVLETKPVAKPAPRESAFSTYSNSEYGATLRYPRNYPLDEGPLDETTESLPGLRSQQELESEEPGTVLVATIAVPDDSFPNTTFAGGSVQFAVNRYLPEGGCQDFPVTRTGDAKAASGKLNVQGVTFTWADSDEGDVSTEFLERDYAGFAKDTCYEFFVRVGVAPTADSEQLRPVNQKKILAQLERIITSLQLEPKPVSMLDQKPSAQHGHPKR
jgi:hypothetical protein